MQTFRLLHILAWGAVSLLLSAHVVVAAEQPVDFARDVQPILQQRCFKCHGTDERDGGLRLTNKRDAFTAADSGEPVIVPGKSAESILIERVTEADKDLRMPPEGEPLSAEQIAVLRRWIDAGAVWPEESTKISNHWAYQTATRPQLPTVQKAEWPQGAIDHFVLKRLEIAGLAPSPATDKAHLIRRVYLALTGLPPSVEEVDTFLADESPLAYERMVDDLLESPRFGEHWARHWLDLARYADSNGFQADQLRDSWAYRDWVIEALNADMPWNQFAIEQLAGDLLPNATLAQKIATGFHRTPTCNVEAGVHPEENRVNQVVDRVNTTGTVFLGTTMECAQCHNHKYDPFTQEEYYKFFAFFNNTPLEVQNGGGSGVSYDFYGPKMELPLEPQQEVRLAELEAQQTKLAKDLKAEQTASAASQKAWEAEVRANLDSAPQWQTLEIVDFQGTGEKHRMLEDGSVLVEGEVPDTTRYTVTALTELSGIRAFKLEALTHDSLPGKGPGRGDAQRPNFILNEFTVAVVDEGDGGRTTPLEFSTAAADFEQNRWEVQGAVDGNPKTGWAVGGEGFHKDHWATFQTRQPVDRDGPMKLTITLEQRYGSGRNIGRFRLLATTSDLSTSGIPAEVATALRAEKPSKAEQKTIDSYYQQQQPRLVELTSQVDTLKKQLAAIQPDTTLIMVEMEEPRMTNVMLRGEYLNPGKQVETGTPEVLHGWKAEWPENRLGLAQWIVDDANPLFARVTVNRWWAEIFGQGIVKTTEDFGTQCEPPSHPELLDWLAVELQDSGYSMKHVLKLMVMSAAFQQSSRVTPDLLERDPDNVLLARGPRYRLSAEMIRDNALAISGLLSTKMGGTPIFPPQPPNIWRQVGRNEPVYKVEQDEDRFRRGVYVVWRRAAPYPSFVNFDGPDRSACVPQRSRTNTPLQALTLLNDEAYVEMALALALQTVQHGPKAQHGANELAKYAFRRTVARDPSERELSIMVRLYQQEHDRLSGDSKTVEQILTAGGMLKLPQDQKLRTQVAAWFFVANALLNLDETITLN